MRSLLLRPTAVGTLVLTAVLGLSSCSSGTTTTTGASTTVAPTTAVAGVSTTAGGATGSSTTAATGSGATAKQVNANTATVAELQAAFEANGVTNAAKWAREVEEYRPYPTDDPTFAALKKDLAKYKPAPDVVQKIVASLSL